MRKTHLLVGGIEPTAHTPRPRQEEVSLVPLKKICVMANVDPRSARRLLRDSKKRPGGRWAWPSKQAEKVIEFLKKETSNENS